MRPFAFGIDASSQSNISPLEMMMLQSLAEISELSNLDNATQILRDFQVTNFTQTTTLDASTATTSDIANFLGTMVDALKKGGLKSDR